MGQPATPAPADADLSGDEYGTDIEYDVELETLVQAVESQVGRSVAAGRDEGAEAAPAAPPDQLMDIEDAAVTLASPFERFRKKGWLSVSDLVGTVWCEVQYDYRLRTMPFLPPSQRLSVIKSESGKEIAVDKVKVEGKEKILRRGEKIHKRLEREIHPQEIVVTASTREDVWGLRFLNMLSALEALLTLGKCRELPVVGFVKGVLVMGIIDELTRKPLDPSNTIGPETRSSRQTSLTSFFSPTKPRPLEPKPRTHKVYVSDSKTRASGTLPRESDTLAGRLQCMVYKELLDAMLLAGPLASASALDPSATADPPPSTSTTATVLPSSSGFSFAQVFALLDLDPSAPFSESFLAQSRPVIVGNDLRWDVAEARCLNDMTRVWERYAEAIGLGCPGSTFVRASTTLSGKQGRSREADTNAGRTENRLELVYRRAGAKERSAGAGTRSGRRKKRRKGEAATFDTKQAVDGASEATLLEEQRLLQLAISESMVSVTSNDGAAASNEPPVDCNHPVSVQHTAPRRPASRQSDYLPERTSDDEREEDELAWAVEMSLAEIQSGSADDTAVVLPLSQRSTRHSPPAETDASQSGQNAVDKGRVSSPYSSPPPSPDKNTASGSIIGRHRFQHDPELVTTHLESVLQFWMGQREPIGVTVDETQRCGWCEFEEGCEWRAKKAEEAWARVRRGREP